MRSEWEMLDFFGELQAVNVHPAGLEVVGLIGFEIGVAVEEFLEVSLQGLAEILGAGRRRLFLGGRWIEH